MSKNVYIWLVWRNDGIFVLDPVSTEQDTFWNYMWTSDDKAACCGSQSVPTFHRAVTLSQLDLVLFITYVNLIVFENRRVYNNPHKFFSSFFIWYVKKVENSFYLS
jgi:hypothetical protein